MRIFVSIHILEKHIMLMIKRNTAEILNGFKEAYRQQNYGIAYQCIVDAMNAAPEYACRLLYGEYSYPFSHVVEMFGKVNEMAAQLETLLSRYPGINAVCGNSPAEVERVLQLREANIAKGLPSALLVTQGKSGSVSVANIFNSGFNLPSFAYSLVNLKIIPGWLKDYIRGGVCYVTHLNPTSENIDLLKKGGVNKVIVHIRDPREAFVSSVHHLSHYNYQTPAYDNEQFRQTSLSHKVEALVLYYYQPITWILGWLRAERSLNIHFSTFNEFVHDKDRFVDQYLDFYGGNRALFNREHATTMREGTDYHFRMGKTNAWQEGLAPEQIEHMNAGLPGALRERFGW
jgi:hypothetical protein